MNILFFGLLLFCGWYPAWRMAAQGWTLDADQPSVAGLALLLFNFGPGVAAFLAVAWAGAEFQQPLGCYLGKPFYLLPAWLLAPMLGALASALSVVFGCTDWDWHTFTVMGNLRAHWPANTTGSLPHIPQAWQLWLEAIFLGPILCLLPAWMQELAWRGYLYQQLQSKGFWITACATGLACWLWQCPLYWLGYTYAEPSWLGASLGLVWALETGIILTWLRQASQGLLAPALARATLMSSALIPLAFTADSQPLWAHLTGGIGLLLLGSFIVAAAGSGIFKSSRA